ncbi:MAG: hypothetical protein F6J89_21010 [Symploca sp. SIO1C4]|uniref:UDP-N-acetyl-alpha-D-muramoyl-L-alanyl-L-glutamate epimerase n=1 Tax=Symploca sp. SIO1C4 TaxID=2607765 RepID=A0A6B3NEJ7_9CYAN|nr:hypothetical protein [Symploca sp. SIO1C4]
MKINIIKILELNIHEHHLEIIYGADGFKFSTKIFYHDLSFSLLINNYSRSTIDQIAAHIALFEGMKLCSLFPKYYDISVIANQLGKTVLEIFSKIYKGVFAQHLYENNVTNYSGPEIISPGVSFGYSEPTVLSGDNQTILAGCGGGKDSIVAMKIMQEAKINFASMQYSHSVYGKADMQHNLISGVLKHATPIRKHLISIYDDFVDYPFLELYFPSNSGITVPETPVSIFESLFLMLDWGYNYLSLAHEKSANTGNLFWDEVGEPVNHQWGKGYEAETELNKFIQENLLSNFTYFSILQPIYDFRIFKNLAKYPEVLPKIHSCNIQKPWCKKCSKCAYVWLGLMATFNPDSVNSIFQVNMFDDDDLVPIFRQMLGLSEHTPFECIGEIDESRLAMKKCLEKGLSGKALDIFVEEILSDYSINWHELEKKYDHVYSTEHAIPDWIFSKIQERL